MIGKRKIKVSDIFALSKMLTEVNGKKEEAKKYLSELETAIHDINSNYILVKKQPNWNSDESVMAAQAVAAISNIEALKAEENQPAPAKVWQIKERDPHIIEVKTQLQPKPTAEEVKKKSSEIFKLEWFMNSRYELRHNEITDQTEYRLSET